MAAMTLDEAKRDLMKNNPTLSPDMLDLMAQRIVDDSGPRKVLPFVENTKEIGSDVFRHGKDLAQFSPLGIMYNTGKAVINALTPVSEDERLAQQFPEFTPAKMEAERKRLDAANWMSQQQIGGSDPVPSMSAQQMLESYMKTNHPPVAGIGAGANANVGYTDSPEYTAQQKQLVDFQKQLGGIAKPQYTMPNAKADMQARFDKLKVPTRPGYSDLSDSDKGSALLRMGLGMMGTKSPYFAQGLAEGGTAGLNDADKSRDTMMKDLMIKYGIDADQAAKLAAAHGQDIAGGNAIASAHYKDQFAPLEAGIKALEVGGKISGQRDTARRLTEHTQQLAGMRQDAARASAEARRDKDIAGDRIGQVLKASAVKEQLENMPGGREIMTNIDRAQKVSDEKERRAALVDIFTKMGDVDPGLLKAAIAATTSEMSTAQILTLVDAATKRK